MSEKPPRNNGKKDINDAPSSAMANAFAEANKNAQSTPEKVPADGTNQEELSDELELLKDEKEWIDEQLIRKGASNPQALINRQRQLHKEMEKIAATLANQDAGAASQTAEPVIVVKEPEAEPKVQQVVVKQQEQKKEKLAVQTQEKAGTDIEQKVPAPFDDVLTPEPLVQVETKLNHQKRWRPEKVIDTEPLVQVETKKQEPEDATPKENRDKLKSLVEKLQKVGIVKEPYAEGNPDLILDESAKLRAESLKEKLSERSRELDIEGEKLGLLEKGFRTLGERYDKAGLKTKIAVGLGLGIGSGIALSAGSLVMASALLGGIAVQRTAGMASLFLRFEKKTQEGKWQKEKAMGKAIAYTAGMTGAMLILAEGVKEGVGYAEQHGWDEQVKDWIGKLWPFGEHAPIAAVTMHAQEMQMPTIEASNHGYEGMLKDLWHQLHNKNFSLPAGADQQSDLAQLLKAHDEHSLNKIVSDLAAKHNFLHINPDHTVASSVLINPDAHMMVDPQGNIHLSQGGQGFINAPADAAVTYPHHSIDTDSTPALDVATTPAAPAAPDVATPEVPAAPDVATTPLATHSFTPETQAVTPTDWVQKDINTPGKEFGFGIPDQNPALGSEGWGPGHTPEAQIPDNSFMQNPALNKPGEGIDLTNLQHHDTVPTPDVEHPASAHAELPAPVVEHVGPFINAHNISINPNAPALYEVPTSSGGTQLIAYGGTDEQRFKFIQDYLTTMKDKQVTVRWAHTTSSIFGSNVRVEDLSTPPAGSHAAYGVQSFFIQPKMPSPDDLTRVVYTGNK